MKTPLFTFLLTLTISLLLAPAWAGIPERPSDSLTIKDIDGQEILFSLEELKAFPMVQEEDCICVGERSGFIGIHDYEGVRLQAVLEKAPGIQKASGYKKENTYLVFIGTDGYQVIASWTELSQAPNKYGALLVLKKNGEPLPESEGAMRLILLGDKFVGRSVKCLERIELRCADGVVEKPGPEDNK